MYTVCMCGFYKRKNEKKQEYFVLWQTEADVFLWARQKELGRKRRNKVRKGDFNSKFQIKGSFTSGYLHDVIFVVITALQWICFQFFMDLKFEKNDVGKFVVSWQPKITPLIQWARFIVNYSLRGKKKIMNLIVLNSFLWLKIFIYC